MIRQPATSQPGRQAGQADQQASQTPASHSCSQPLQHAHLRQSQSTIIFSPQLTASFPALPTVNACQQVLQNANTDCAALAPAMVCRKLSGSTAVLVPDGPCSDRGWRNSPSSSVTVQPQSTPASCTSANCAHTVRAGSSWEVRGGEVCLPHGWARPGQRNKMEHTIADEGSRWGS